jgi:hypothetical protein
MIICSTCCLVLKAVSFPVAGRETPVGGRLKAVVGLVLVVAVAGLDLEYP